MSSSNRWLLAPCVIAILAAGSACAGSGATSNASPQASSSAKATQGGSSKLDPAVAMPAGFPSDVPVYPGARLTAAAQFAGNGSTTWGMEWETVNGADKVQTFYTSNLAQGDWSISFSGAANGAFSAIFNRKSNSKDAGILGLDGSTGVTKISMSLVSA
ncbi:MAG: hypothetical protein ABI334_06270 [Candidatus Dormiibacterota bacterium]